ncbi:MAG: hypothetical protein HYR62_08455 [Actinobacteria bacterium]|nr:hypothetical protein [Actinomycetota bacterium]MBI3686222.1 hypothetical protein [Actinomycetota bacterium]
MRVALAGHDFGAVYRALRRWGYSRQMIADLTGQTSPEVEEISRGRRRIGSYAVLVRVTCGLGIPPGLVGLSWCDCPVCRQPLTCPPQARYPQPAGPVADMQSDSPGPDAKGLRVAGDSVVGLPRPGGSTTPSTSGRSRPAGRRR